MANLKRAGLVQSSRGAHGGYRLARPAAEIAMDEVVLALEGAIAPMECFVDTPAGKVSCNHGDDASACSTKLLWMRVQSGVITGAPVHHARRARGVRYLRRARARAHRRSRGRAAPDDPAGLRDLPPHQTKTETMSHLEIKNLHVRAGDKEILKGLDLSVGKGEIHALMGPNGSGKSTLANVIMGHPSLEVTEGQVIFKGEDITEADPDERARMGLFMAFQYPVSVPGVTVTKYLRTVMNAHREAHGEDPISLKDFRTTVEAAMKLTEVPREFSSRYLNEGFSGGEKKRMEILQLALQKPENGGARRDRLRARHRRAPDRRERREHAQQPGHGRPDHHPLPAHPPHGAAEPRARALPGPDREGGRPRARHHARGEGLRLDQGRGGGGAACTRHEPRSRST